MLIINSGVYTQHVHLPIVRFASSESHWRLFLDNSFSFALAPYALVSHTY